MKIMVFDVPAESGGALSVLKDFYNEARLCKNKSINWIFVVSKPCLQETKNIKILQFPWIKKSWGHRVYFDHVIASNLIRKYKVDRVLSLQNVVIPYTKVNQILYVHNSLPFVDYRFTFRENKLLWIYQNIISKSIIKSIRNADKVIVQTEWMKKSCVEKAGIENRKISVAPPQIRVKVNKFFEANEDTLSTFFYPASGMDFKNHKLIIEACKILKEKGIRDFKVIFTLKGDENKNVFRLYKEVKTHNLPIDFLGNLSRNQVFDMYAKSILLFPSFVESSPLPLTEAKLHKSIIFVSDCSFSHEILDKYKNAYFFNPFDSNKLFELMESVVIRKLIYFSGCVNMDGEESINKTISDIITV